MKEPRNRNRIQISSSLYIFPSWVTAGVSLYFHFIYFHNLENSPEEKIFSDEINVRHFILTEWKYWWWTVLVEFGDCIMSAIFYILNQVWSLHISWCNVKWSPPMLKLESLTGYVWTSSWTSDLHCSEKKFNHEKSRLYVFNSGLNGDAGYQLWTKCTMQETNYDFFHEVQNYGCKNVVNK